jgi:predicted CoA-binding protein
MERSIEDFINCKRIAVVGYSRDKRKFGNTAYAELKQRGYEVFAVHPTGQEIGGVTCYPDLHALRGIIDAVFISVSSKYASSVLEEAASIGVNHIWLQQGAESPEVLQTASRLRLNPVTKKCVLMYAPPVRSIHGWHRAVVRWFGRL